MSAPYYYRLKRDQPGCEHCDHGGTWTVAWGEGENTQQLSESFDDLDLVVDIMLWMQNAFDAGSEFGWIDHTKRVHPPALAIAGLPFPRLQLTWHQLPDGQFLVTYDLLIPVEPGDIRDEKRLGYICRPITGGTLVERISPFEHDNRLGTTFRDGMHIYADAALLNMPAYVVYGGHYRKLGAA